MGSRQKKKVPYSKEEARKQKRIANVKTTILAIVVGGVILAGVLGYYKIVGGMNDAIFSAVGNPETMEQDIEGATKLTLIGDFETVEMHAKLDNGESDIAYLTEEGVVNPTLWIMADGEKVLAIRPNESAFPDVTGRVFEFCDKSGSIIGYAAEADESGAFLLYDSKKGDTGYKLDQKGARITDSNGNSIAACDYFPSTNDVYIIDAKFEEGTIPACYKCLMLYLNYQIGYSYHENGVMP